MDDKKPVVNTETAPEYNHEEIKTEQTVRKELGVDWAQVRIQAIRTLFGK